MDVKTIVTENGIPIEFLSKTHENYIDKTTLIFGASNSGKTTLIREIMYICKEHMPNILVIAPSPSDLPYQGIVPKKCIKEDLSKARLDSIWLRQHNYTQVYNIANDPDVLRSLFEKTDNRKLGAAIYLTESASERKIEEVNACVELDDDKKLGFIEIIEKKCRNKLIHYYKMAIRESKGALMSKHLTPKEKIALEYLDCDPRIMIIVDDCSEKLKHWMKYYKKDEINVFDNIFYKGRHHYITLLIATHDDKLIDPEFRKNTRVTFYMGSNMFVPALNRGANGFTKQQKKDGEIIDKRIFGDSKDTKIKNYKKICFIKEDTNPFKYTIAKKYPDFKMGSPSLWELCDRMPNKSENIDENPFIKDLIRFRR